MVDSASLLVWEALVGWLWSRANTVVVDWVLVLMVMTRICGKRVLIDRATGYR